MASGDTRALSSRSFEVVTAVWILAGLLLLSVVALTRLRGREAARNSASVVEILSLDTLASSPSGTTQRVPGGAHPAVVPAHAPGVRGWLSSSEGESP